MALLLPRAVKRSTKKKSEAMGAMLTQHGVLPVAMRHVSRLGQVWARGQGGKGAPGRESRTGRW